jgi:hypothetical protein
MISLGTASASASASANPALVGCLCPRGFSFSCLGGFRDWRLGMLEHVRDVGTSLV